MRALLARADRGGAPAGSSGALCALRRRRRLGPGLQGRRRVTRRNRLTGIGIGLAALVLAADQISKWWVLNGLDLPRIGAVRLLPVLDLAMVWNRGVTFGLLNGLGAWSGPAIALVALAIIVVLAAW